MHDASFHDSKREIPIAIHDERDNMLVYGMVLSR